MDTDVDVTTTKENTPPGLLPADEDGTVFGEDGIDWISENIKQRKVAKGQKVVTGGNVLGRNKKKQKINLDTDLVTKHPTNNAAQFAKRAPGNLTLSVEKDSESATAAKLLKYMDDWAAKLCPSVPSATFFDKLAKMTYDPKVQQMFSNFNKPQPQEPQEPAPIQPELFTADPNHFGYDDSEEEIELAIEETNDRANQMDEFAQMEAEMGL